MKRCRIVVSLTNDDNDYQQAQAVAADKAGRRLDAEVKIIHAGNDALTQSQQLLQCVQASADLRPDAIVFEPAGGTAFPQVARAAVAAGIGWVVLNHEADYLAELRNRFQVPVFAISSDHQEVGKIQGKQVAALLPNGGSVLYIEGPPNSSAAKERTRGMMRSKPANVQLKSLRANWTEDSAYRTVSSWLRLRTSVESRIDLVAAQDDSMAVGAKKAFNEIAEEERARWMKVPVIGCDGMPKTGQAWVRNGTLAATIYIRPNADLAIEMLVQAIRAGVSVPEVNLTVPESVPALESLAKSAAGKSARSASV